MSSASHTVSSVVSCQHFTAWHGLLVANLAEQKELSPPRKNDMGIFDPTIFMLQQNFIGNFLLKKKLYK